MDPLTPLSQHTELYPSIQGAYRVIRQQILTTAILIIIDVRYHDFNGFPAVKWYYKPLEVGNGRQLF